MISGRAALVERLGHQFADATLLEAALTHRSARGVHNERLEFLGDAVLGLVVADELYRRRPQLREGELTRARAALVRAESLAEIGAELGVGEFLNLGEGELKSGGHRRGSILGDAVEALVGAIYLDGGFEAARTVVVRIFDTRFDELPDAGEPKDAKTRLQEWLQGRGHERPEYPLLETTGPDHEQQFRVACEVSGLQLRAEASGDSRRRAEQTAAAAVLAQLENRSG